MYKVEQLNENTIKLTKLNINKDEYDKQILENGDMLIVDNWIREKEAERYLPSIPKGDKNLREGYYTLLKANETAEEKLIAYQKEIDKLRKEIENLKNPQKDDSLPF